MRALALLQASTLILLLACGSEKSTPSDDPIAQSSVAGSASNDASSSIDEQPTSAKQDVDLAADERKSEPKKAARGPGERPLPAFSGPTLAGTQLSISSLIGRRMLLYFFNPDAAPTEIVTGAVVEVARLQKSHNFRVVGVAIGSNTPTVREFVKKHAIEFPVIDDSSANISSLLGLQGTAVVVGADPEGYVTFVLPGFDTTAPGAQEAIEASLRESLRITASPHTGKLIQRVQAPGFVTEDIDGKPFDLASLDGRPKIIMFFLHTCPHCHKALAFFKEQLASIPEAKRPALVAISLQNRPSAVRISLGELDLDYFTPLVDPTGGVGTLYGLSGGVPDISLVAANGDIVYRMQGWREDRDPALMRMYLNRIAGEKIPMLLSRTGFTGNDACVACHEQEAATWELTSHARAFDTLVTHGQERDPECVSCHVVGFDQPGGFSFANPAVHLENVGCESCHGRGGPHLSPDFVGEQGYAAVCETCHDKKHSLGFEFGSFLPGVSHSMIAAMTDEQRTARFAEGITHRELLPSTANYVGSDACQSCHESEFATWSKSGHAHSVESLEKSGKVGEPDCLSCHTTAYGKPGGYPTGPVATAHHPDLARVGCESCHGPGGKHVEEGARRIGTIVSLGDKCDSCVILQICGSCHDAENDSDFEFSVQEHIDRQRHGTIEAGTGKPLGGSAVLFAPASDEARIAQALRWLEAAPPGDG
jgi:peroxiredoxin